MSIGKETPEAPAPGDDEVVPETAATEAEGEDTEEAEGEDESPEGEAPEGEEAEGEKDEDGKPSKSKARRERTRARIATLEDIARRESQRADNAAAALKSLTSDAGPEPKESDYSDERKYTAALAAWEADRRLLAREKQSRESHSTEAVKDASAAKQSLFRERVLALADRYPDIEAKVFDPSAPINQVMAEVIQESDRAAELAYHLATHREEALRIQRMSPLAAAREIGRIEASLDTPKPKTQTTAPKPVPKLAGSMSKATKDPDKMTSDEWLEWRNAQLRRKKG